MRADMHKVVTEKPRRGSGYNNHHRNTVTATRGKDREFEGDSYMGLRFELDGGLETRSLISNHVRVKTLLGNDRKDFSDVLGPLHRYLLSQVGRPWDKVYSELSASLDRRSMAGIYIWGHVKQFVETNGLEETADGRIVRRLYGYARPVGLYVHPRTGLLSYGGTPRRSTWAKSARAQAHLAALGKFGIGGYYYLTRSRAARFRVINGQVWEHRPDRAWLIRTYQETSESVRRWSNGQWVTVLHKSLLWVGTKQASQKEIRAAWEHLREDPTA